MNEPWKVVELGQGMTLGVVDETNRYFGDYHRVCLRTTLSCSLAVVGGPERVELVKTLERMAVSTERVEQVREQLLENFIEHVRRYLLVEGFAERLWRKQQQVVRVPAINRYG
jgi:hypothetical protein